MKVILLVFVGYVILMVMASYSGKPEVERLEKMREEAYRAKFESVYVESARKYAKNNYRRKWESYK